MGHSGITWSEDVLAVCRKWRETAPVEAMVREPYLPHVPENWNGVLVLAEAQQLAGAHTYREWLNGLPSEQRMIRLSLKSPDGVGVGPWDNGIVKLALKAMLPEIDVEQTAVSNAVPWFVPTAYPIAQPIAMIKIMNSARKSLSARITGPAPVSRECGRNLRHRSPAARRHRSGSGRVVSTSECRHRRRSPG